MAVPRCGDTLQDGVSNFALLARYHANASTCRRAVSVVDFAAMTALSKACSSIFAQLDRDDLLQRAAARDAWLVKASLMLTALPFDDPRLALDELLLNLRDTSASVPGLRGPVNDLAALVRQLASESTNPKRNRLLELLASSPSTGDPVAVLANVCGSPTPGWPTSIDGKCDFGSAEVELVRLKRQTKGSLYGRLLIPGNPWFAPRGVLFDLLYGGRASDIVVLAYRAERVSLPTPRKLPTGFVFTAIDEPIQKAVDANEPGADTQLDQWAHESFWTSIHEQHADISPQSDTDVTVDATFVLFADGSGAFLPSDRRIVEVSELFETGASFEISEDKLPRTSIRDLEEGHLVMLRLSGSGDYLDDVADALIEQAGETGLRERALKWKDRLHQVIRRHGEGVVAMNLRRQGVKLRSPQYLWAWSGDAVMAPHDRETFQRLIIAIWELESTASEEVPRAYADLRWGEMERLKAYHHRAGVSIRAALLSRVRSLVTERRRIDIVESIELPGVAAGRIGLLRVAAVDSKTRKIPVSRLYQLSKVKVK
jgi:hypothetical protein